MTLVIVGIFLIGCLLIATENVTKVNRAAVAIFAGTGSLYLLWYGLRDQSACV